MALFQSIEDRYKQLSKKFGDLPRKNKQLTIALIAPFDKTYCNMAGLHVPEVRFGQAKI